ncbi:MAG: hypothetical protein R2865_10860, partial [Deinococcales bacterium]
MNHGLRQGLSLRLWLFLILWLFLAACSNVDSPTPKPNANISPKISPLDLALNQINLDQRKPLGGLVPLAQSLKPLNGTGSQRLAMKLLVITASISDSGLAAIELMLKQVGVPYDVFFAVDPAEKVGSTGRVLTSADLIAANGDGKYQGIILTDSGLSYDTGNGFASAFSNTEWNLLWQYAREYQVRQLTLFGFPGTFPEDLGLRFDSAQSPTIAAPLNIKLAAAPNNTLARSVFASLKPSIEIPIVLAY